MVENSFQRNARWKARWPIGSQDRCSSRLKIYQARSSRPEPDKNSAAGVQHINLTRTFHSGAFGQQRASSSHFNEIAPPTVARDVIIASVSFRAHPMELFAPRHLLVILVVALVVFGGKKLKTLGSDLGSAVRGFKQAMKEGEAEEAKATPVEAPRP
jgi:sec-independent protein translocase protein TatA